MSRRPRDQATVADAMETMRADYAAAKSSRFRRRRSGVPSAGAGADYHYRSESDYLKLMELARDYDRNDVLMGAMVDRAAINTIQDGIHVDPSTGDPELDADLKADWQTWSEDEKQCDLAQEHTLAELEWQAMRAVIVDGDIQALLNRVGAIEMIEGHRLRTPRWADKHVVHGVLLDAETRQRKQYYFTADDIDPSKALNKNTAMQPYPTRDEAGNRQVCHVYHPKRVTQTRGVTCFAPIFDQAGMFEDICFAKLVQQQMVACFAVIEERPLEFKVPASTKEAQVGPQTTETDADGNPRTLEGMGPGMRIKGAPGAKIKLDSANVPNPEFFPHMRMVIQLVGMNLGLPLVLALMDASETNFSGWRGAMEQAKLGFQQNQRMIYRRFVKPVYEWRVRQRIANEPAMAAASQRLGKLIFRHSAGYPTWPYVEPLKDASADLLQTRNALISQRRRCARRNLDWDDLSTEIVEDNAQLIEKAAKKAKELNDRYPDLRITWRELACLPTPDGMTVSAAAAMDSDGQAAAGGGRGAGKEEEADR